MKSSTETEDGGFYMRQEIWQLKAKINDIEIENRHLRDMLKDKEIVICCLADTVNFLRKLREEGKARWSKCQNGK
jgi:carbamoylphosphate synthase small subunit